MKTTRKNYLEDVRTRDWMNKNILPNRHSQFIREATKAKMEAVKDGNRNGKDKKP